MKWKRALWLAVPWTACSTLPFLIWLGVIIIYSLQRPTQTIDTQSIDYSESFNQWIRVVRVFGVVWLSLMLPGPAVGAGLLAWERALAAHVVSVERRIWSALSLVVGLIWSTLAAALVWSALAWFALATGHEDWVGGIIYVMMFYMWGYMWGWLWLPALPVVAGAVGGWGAWRGARAVRRNESR